MILNIIGVKQTGRFQVGLVLLLIGILVLYGLRGTMFIQSRNYLPFMPSGLGSIFATAGLVFVSFGGLTKIACVAEEVRRPGRNIPLGMFLAFFVVMILYGLVVFVTIGLLEPTALSSSLTPISDGAGSFMGTAGAVMLAIAALMAFISTANAGILTASRASMAMSRDHLLPRVFKKISSKSKTPIVSIIFTSIFMISIILFLDLENLVKTASTLMLLLFILVNLSIIVMRESKIQGYRPRFRAPLYPWLQIAGIIGYGFLIFEMGRLPLTITAIFVVCALAWYFIYARRKVKRQAAFVHVVERLTAKELADPTLPNELKEIVIERDEIVEDRFDHLIRDCQILDFEYSLKMKEFFEEISQALAKQLDANPSKIYDQLLEREKESSTVIREGLAIPHIIIDGRRKFKVLLARCKPGIVFPDINQKVHIVFVLAGTKDERNFHLRALAAIAEIAQASDFDKKWLSARNIQELRDIILLAERKRFTGH